ncbi:MAG: hypothetical protein ACRELY_11760, partial [Polyangiaceae bacterium]
MRTGALLVFLTLASTWAACEGLEVRNDGGPLPDAGLDAKIADAASSDAASYYTVLDIDADTAPDFSTAAFDPFVGVWNPLPSRPYGCSPRYAADPSVSVPPLIWTACASGRDGCQRLVVDWTSSPTKSLAFPLTEPIRVVNG